MNDRAPLLDSALAKLRAELGDTTLAQLTPDDAGLLAARCGGDAARLRRWLKRRLAGEPLAYIVGALSFAGLTLRIDRRAYVTDPETEHLVRAVINRAQALADQLRRAPRLAELGVGCGSLSLAVKHAFPAAELTGLDLDPAALALAAENSARLGLPLRLLESDLFAAWPDGEAPPDLVFGDPPWGDVTTLYAADRPATHYEAMPPASAFPFGGPAGVHRQIIADLARRGWRETEVWLNGGVLPADTLVAAASAASRVVVHTPAPGLRLLQAGWR